jgi:hypothetical protein
MQLGCLCGLFGKEKIPVKSTNVEILGFMDMNIDLPL